MLRRLWCGLVRGHHWVLYGHVDVRPEEMDEGMFISVGIHGFYFRCSHCGATIQPNDICIHTPGGTITTQDEAKDKEVEKLRKMVGL